MKTLIPLVLAAATLAGCGETEPADVASKRASSLPAPQPVAGAVDAETPAADAAATVTPSPGQVAEGSWTGKTMASAPAALFGGPDMDASFSVRCEDSTIVFARTALLPAGEASMSITAGGETRRLAARTQEEPMPQVTARLPAADPFAATLARASDPVAVTVGQGERYTMPSSPVLRGVVAGCMGA